jgi:hypothetical protein
MGHKIGPCRDRVNSTLSLIAQIQLEYSACVLKTVVFPFVSRISTFGASHAVYLDDLKC